MPSTATSWRSPSISASTRGLSLSAVPVSGTAVGAFPWVGRLKPGLCMEPRACSSVQRPCPGARGQTWGPQSPAGMPTPRLLLGWRVLKALGIFRFPATGTGTWLQRDTVWSNVLLACGRATFTAPPPTFVRQTHVCAFTLNHFTLRHLPGICVPQGLLHAPRGSSGTIAACPRLPTRRGAAQPALETLGFWVRVPPSRPVAHLSLLPTTPRPPTASLVPASFHGKTNGFLASRALRAAGAARWLGRGGGHGA